MAVIKEFDTEKTILKYFDCKAFAAKLAQNDSRATTVDGRKIVLAGTPFPANDATCTGLVLHDYDVTENAVEAAIIYDGAVDLSKISSSVEIAAAAKGAVPKIKFFE